MPDLDLAPTRKALHRWAGVEGTLGFPDITRQARTLEDQIETAVLDHRDDLREKLIELLHEFTHAVPVEQSAAAPRKRNLPFSSCLQV